ncbi:MAG: ImmA/IrrE family metallo-endopeptidase [Fibrella sp.]|nr:ImmA/IrrE family metallo-endopeptidase [Armatimonadota bacterium]
MSIPNIPTEEFSPRRLTVARQRREFTKKDLAGAVNVTAQMVTFYEDGRHTPEVATARRIAEALDFPLAFFYGDEVDTIPLEAISFRSRRAMTAKVRDKTTASGEVAACIVSPALARRFRLPVPAVPDLNGETPEVAAQVLRAQWGLGQAPVTNVVHLLESVGVQIYWFEEESPFVDAVSFWRDVQPFVLLSQRSRGGERARFDLSHELGHLVLHRRVEDMDGQQVENEADRFASSFLMPADQFRSECPKFPTLNQLLNMKERWKVSLQAMVRRCRDTSILSQWQYECAFRQISTNGWRVQEPGKLDWETSAIHKQVLDRLVDKRVYPEDLARDVHLTVRELAAYIPTINEYRQAIQEETPQRYLTIDELGYSANY